MSFDSSATTDYSTMRGRNYPAIRQFTVFLENKVGKLLEVIRRFEGSRVRIVALSISENAECAFVRFLLSHPEQGREILERAGLAIVESDLIGVELPEGPQGLMEICTALLQAAEDDAQRLGAGGLVAWGVSIPVFMRAAWFRRHGYRAVDSQGMMKLLWKPFRGDVAAPSWVKTKRKPLLQDGKVVVTSVINGWCPGQNLAHERARRAAAELGPNVVFQQIDAFERNVGMEWGASDALFVDGRQVRTGPPPRYEKVRNLIARRAARLL